MSQKRAAAGSFSEAKHAVADHKPLGRGDAPSLHPPVFRPEIGEWPWRRIWPSLVNKCAMLLRKLCAARRGIAHCETLLAQQVGRIKCDATAIRVDRQIIVAELKVGKPRARRIASRWGADAFASPFGRLIRTGSSGPSPVSGPIARSHNRKSRSIRKLRCCRYCCCTRRPSLS